MSDSDIRPPPPPYLRQEHLGWIATLPPYTSSSLPGSQPTAAPSLVSSVTSSPSTTPSTSTTSPPSSGSHSENGVHGLQPSNERRHMVTPLGFLLWTIFGSRVPNNRDQRKHSGQGVPPSALDGSAIEMQPVASEDEPTAEQKPSLLQRILGWVLATLFMAAGFLFVAWIIWLITLCFQKGDTAICWGTWDGAMEG